MNTMNEINYQEEQEEQKRPTLLTVLAVLSFISLGFSVLGNLFSWVSGPASEEAMYEQKVEFTKSKAQMLEAGADGFAKMFDQLYLMMEQTNQSFFLSQSLTTLMLGLGIVGVIFMLKGKRLGFHLYIIYSLLAVGGIFMYVSPANVPLLVTILGVVFSGIFIFLYSRNLRWMTK